MNKQTKPKQTHTKNPISSKLNQNKQTQQTAERNEGDGRWAPFLGRFFLSCRNLYRAPIVDDRLLTVLGQGEETGRRVAGWTGLEKTVWARRWSII